MKTFRRLALFVIVAIFVAVPIRAAQAQTAACPKALKPDDCTLITTAGKNLNQFTTFVADYQLYGQITGLLPSPATITLNGKAPFSVQQDATSFIDALDSLSFQTTTLGSANFNQQVYGLALDVRTIKGDMHIKGVAAAGSKGWSKISLPKVLTALSTRGIPILGNLSSSEVRVLRGVVDPDLVSSLANLESIPGLVKITRQAGSYIDNQPTIQITATFDMPTLAKHLYGDGSSILKDISNTLGKPFSDLDPTDPQVAAGIKQSSLAVTWYFGSKDQLYHGFSFTSMLRLQGKAADLLSGKTKSPTINIKANTTVRLSQIGKPVTIQEVKAADVVNDLTDSLVTQIELR